MPIFPVIVNILTGSCGKKCHLDQEGKMPLKQFEFCVAILGSAIKDE